MGKHTDGPEHLLAVQSDVERGPRLGHELAHCLEGRVHAGWRGRQKWSVEKRQWFLCGPHLAILMAILFLETLEKPPPAFSV